MQQPGGRGRGGAGNAARGWLEDGGERHRIRGDGVVAAVDPGWRRRIRRGPQVPSMEQQQRINKSIMEENRHETCICC